MTAKTEAEAIGSARVINSQIRFREPFTLGKSGTVHAAGLYSIDTEEKRVGDAGPGMWQRTGSSMRRIAQGSEYVSVDSEALNAALARDRAGAGTPAERAGFPRLGARRKH